MLLEVHLPFPTTPATGTIAKSRLTAIPPDQEVQFYRRWAALGARLFDLEQLFNDVQGLVDTEVALDPDEEPDEVEPSEDEASDLGLFEP